MSGDQTAEYVPAMGPEKYLDLEECKKVLPDDGLNTWVTSGKGQFLLVTKK